MVKYFLSTWILFGILAGLSLTEPVVAAPRQARFANINYDVVYVRCPRGKEPVLRPTSGAPASLLNWNGVNDLWLSATNNIYHQPGCDLVLHRSNMTPGDPAAEKVLVNCDENNASSPVCSVVDPNVSFDGRYVVYAKFTDTRTFVTDLGIRELKTVGLQSFMKLYPNCDGPSGRCAENQLIGLRPYAAPTLIFMYDLQTGIETQISPNSTMFAGRAHPGKDPEWTSNIPVMDTGPFFTPDGRIGFTSNREQGFGMFQLFAMDRDGRSMEVMSHRAMANQLHPISLMDGRIIYTNFDRMLQRTTNNDFSLFEINPDGSAPFIFAGKNDSTEWTYHYVTQLSDGDIVTTLYYNQQQTGLGSLERFPVNPPGPDFVHRTRRDNEAGAELTTPLDTWSPGTGLLPFARPGQFRLTPLVSAGDTQAGSYAAADYFTHPVDGRTVTMTGRFTHPAAAPNNDLLATYAIGGASTVNSSAFRELSTTLKIIGKDAGIWLLPLEPNSTRRIGHIADDAQIVVDFPQYHEIMPRAVVSYQDIYGISRPDPNNTRPPTSNDGTQDQRLPAGAPYGLTGASSMYDRETRSLNGTPWNMKDGGGQMSGRTYMNMAVSGSELAVFGNNEIYGIRILMPVPNIPKDIYKGDEKWSGIQHHHLRILGEYPVRKPDGGGKQPVDDQGNPDTSFIVRVPADTPFLMETLDKRGMALDIETASRSVARGEQQFCVGCHVHTRDGMDPFASRAKTNITKFGDFTGASAPLFVGVDADGYPTVASAQATYPGEAGATARHSFAVDWDNNIAAIMQNRCASCHGQGKAAQQLTGLLLDGSNNTYQLITENRIRDNGGNTLLSANSKPGNGLTDIDASGTDRITPHYDCCTPSRWVSVNSARSSMLVWALYGERLDGRDPVTGLPPAGSGVVVDTQGREYPEIWPKVGEHLAHVSGMPEAEKRLIARWLDIGAPKRNVHDDMMRPVMTLTPMGGAASVDRILVGLWDDSPLDFTRFAVTVNGTDITPQVTGTPAIVTVLLPTTVTDTNADSIEVTLEIWDKPDRTWSMVRPGEAAANRTRRSVTGRALLRMAGSAANSAPTAASASITTYENTQSPGVYAQVSDPDAGDSHLVSIVSQPSKGTAQVIDNKLVYIPDTGFVGNDSFQFRASDLGGLSVDGTASVTVLAGSPPVGGGNSAPTAASASITTNENTQSAGVDAQVTDPDVGDTHTLSIVTQPSNGIAQVVNNKLFYTPASGFVGNDSFQFRASDSGNLSVTGIASVTVLANTGGSSTGSGTSGGGGGSYGLLELMALCALLFAFRRRSRVSFFSFDKFSSPAFASQPFLPVNTSLRFPSTTILSPALRPRRYPMSSTEIMLSFKKLFWVLLLINMFAVGCAAAAVTQHPNILINAQEIAAIKAKISITENNGVVTVAGEEPWKSAARTMIEQADAALGLKPVSVTFGGSNSCGGGSRIFCTGAFYNGAADRYDWEKAAKPLGIGVRDLGMAYAFTGDSRYAEKLIELVRVWALDPVTGMLPRFSNNQSLMDLFGTMTGVIYGVDLAWNYPGWELADKDAFKAWVQTFGNNTVYAFGQSETNAAPNNFENWRNAFLSIAGAFLGDQRLLDIAYRNFRNAIPKQVHWTGRLGQESGRTNGWAGLGYSIYAIHAMTLTAEVARHHGVDLYNYLGEDSGGKPIGLKTALDFHVPYVMNPASWKWGKNPDYPLLNNINANSGVGIYEVAYSMWQDPGYLSVINKWGRPMRMNMWALGVVTLTHANRFDLALTPMPPSIVSQPTSVTVTEGEDASFSINASGSEPMNYQWLRNGGAIVGATSASYTVTAASASDSGSVFSCDVSNSLGSITSDGAVLTVLTDVTAPTLVSAFAISDSRVDIVFSEAVGASSAVNPANYQIDLGISVTSASLSSDGRTVTLTVSTLAADTAYTVQVSNVQDQAQTPNTIAALSGKTFTYRTADGFTDGNADGWAPLDSTRWSVVMDEGDMAYYLNTSNFSSPGGGRLGEYSLLPGNYSDFTFAAQARLGDAVGSNGLADYAVMFGYQDADNYDYVMFNNEQSATQLFKVVNGTRTVLATANSDWLNDNLYHSIEVSRVGSAINVRFDGNLILSASDSMFRAGKVGVGSYNDSAYFDDVSVTGEASAPPADTTSPVISLVGANPQTITVGSAYTELGAMAMDNVDGNLSGSITTDASDVDTTTEGSYSVTYNVSDAAGNAATQVTRMVNVTAAAANNPDNSNGGGGGALGPLMGLGIMLLTFRRCLFKGRCLIRNDHILSLYEELKIK